MTTSFSPQQDSATSVPVAVPVPVIVVHGGAGDRGRDAAHIAGCKAAAAAGRSLLLAGKSALDTVQHAVEVLEANPIFNAGHGSVPTTTGEIELDASLMEGENLRAGAVAMLPPYPHPIAAARAVLDEGLHVLYGGEGAATLAEQSAQTRITSGQMRSTRRTNIDTTSKGTVGAVALDTSGHLAAATSTGGTRGQRPGRIGDSPLIGAGTYADDTAGACSTTGDGETILRLCLAFAACEALRGGATAQAAARATLAHMEKRLGGTGGMILITPQGDVGIHWTTPAMIYAVGRQGEDIRTGGDQPPENPEGQNQTGNHS